MGFRDLKWLQGQVAVAGLALALIAGCTQGSPPAVPEASPTGTTPPPTSYGGVELGTSPCVVETPESWGQILSDGLMWPAHVSSISPLLALPDERAVFTRVSEAGTSITSIFGPDLVELKRLLEFSVMPDSGGSAFNPVIGTRAGAFFVDRAGDGRWELYVWDRLSDEVLQIDSIPTNAAGQPLVNGYQYPVVTDHAVWWLRGVENGQGLEGTQGVKEGFLGNELVRYDLDTRSTEVILSGYVSEFLAHGDDLIALSRPADHPGGVTTSLVIRAFDQETGAEVDPPVGLDINEAITWVKTDGDMIAWSGLDIGVRAWRPEWGRSIELVPSALEKEQGVHISSTMSVYLWWPYLVSLDLVNLAAPDVLGRGVWVFDLRANSFASLPDLGGWPQISMTDGNLLITVRPREPSPDGVERFDTYLIDVTELTGLTTCPSPGKPASSPATTKR